MIQRPPRSTRTDTLFPYTTLFLSGGLFRFLVAFGDLGQHAAVPEQTVAAFDLASIHQPVADPVEPPGGRAASPCQPLGVVGYRAAAISYQGQQDEIGRAHV